MYNLEHLAMTNREPSERARLSTPEHHMATIPRTAESRGDRWRLGAIGGLGVLLMLVGIMYAMNERASTTASAPPPATTSAQSTVGQGATSSRPTEDDATPPNQLQK
jgi:hypothetical protein